MKDAVLNAPTQTGTRPVVDFDLSGLGAACGCDAPSHASGLISIDDALSRIADHVAPVAETETVPLQNALGRVLCAPIRARSDMPRFDNAAMDGYAVCAADLQGEGPWRLSVSARIAAGESVGETFEPGTAVQVFTGAPVPPGATCVVMQERVKRDGAHIWLKKRPTSGDNIRHKGEERQAGQDIFAVGTRLSARAIGACASSGHGIVPVRRKLRVTLLVSGSEVAAVGAGDLDKAQIWDVNTPMFQASLSRPDIDLVTVSAVEDNLVATTRAISEAARQSDLVITTGGVSVGEEDHLRAAITDLNGVTHFAGVALKPGKPVSFGHIGSAVWLGLPGNPQSAFVTWTLFGEAILNRLSGLAAARASRRHVVLGHAISRKPGRCEVRPATLTGCDGTGRDQIDCPSGICSGQVASLAHADGLAFLPADADHLPSGALVEFLPFCQS